MTIYPQWWRKHFLLTEFLLGLVITALLMVWERWLGGRLILDHLVRGNRGQIYGTFASIFGSLLGFAITAMSVVLGFSSQSRFAVLRQSHYYKQLWDVFTSTIRYLGVVSVLWLSALFVDRDISPKPWILALSLGASLIGVFGLSRCVWVLERIVQVIITQPESTVTRKHEGSA